MLIWILKLHKYLGPGQVDRLEVCLEKVCLALKVYLVVILKLSLGSRIDVGTENVVVILQCLIKKSRGQPKNKLIFQHFIAISAKDAPLNENWILGLVLEVLVDLFQP